MTTKKELSARLAEVDRRVADLDQQVTEVDRRITDLDRRITDLDDRLRRLEFLTAEDTTGKTVADHEKRLRRLEVWVAGTEFTNEEGQTYYPLAGAVKPWADPEEVARLVASDDNQGLDRLIYGNLFAGLPSEAIPTGDDDFFAQEDTQGEKSIFEELPPLAGLPEDLAVALAGFVYDADLHLNTDRVLKVVAALGGLTPG